MSLKKKFDVFLSHNSADRPWAIKLKGSLQTRGIKVWLDNDEIRPGDWFAAALEKGIKESKALALIISPESMQSDWVKAEYYRAVNLATNKQIQLIPVLYKFAEIPGFLEDRNWVDFSNEEKYDENVKKLIWGITGDKTKSDGRNKSNQKKRKVASVPTKEEISPYTAGLRPSAGRGQTQREITFLTNQITNPFIRYLERTLRMENAHWIRAGLSIPTKEFNFTLVYFQAQSEIFKNIQTELYLIYNKLGSNEVNPTQDTFMDHVGLLLKQALDRVKQIEDLLGPSNKQYDLGLALREAAKVACDDIYTIDQLLKDGAVTLLIQPIKYESIADDLNTEISNLAISLEEIQKYLIQTYDTARQEHILVT